MKETFEYNGYKGTSEYSLEDKVYHGKLLDINDLVTYESKTEEGLEKEFKLAIKDYLQDLQDLGKVGFK